MQGTPTADYCADSSAPTLATYANLHFALEELRSSAATANELGPRVLVVGAADAGKTALVQTLAAYAAPAACPSP